MTSTFVVGMLLFIWSSILVGISFVLFYKTNLCVNLGWALAAIPFLGGAKEFFGLTMQRLSGNIRLFMIIVLFGAFSINTNAQKYSVVSITGKVMVENTNTKKQRELQLREQLSGNTVLYLPFKGQVELFCEQTGKKHILKAPGKGNLQKMLSNKENTVIQLTKHYLAYIKARMKSDGELSARHYSDPATVTREINCCQMRAFSSALDNLLHFFCDFSLYRCRRRLSVYQCHLNKKLLTINPFWAFPSSYPSYSSYRRW